MGAPESSAEAAEVAEAVAPGPSVIFTPLSIPHLFTAHPPQLPQVGGSPWAARELELAPATGLLLPRPELLLVLPRRRLRLRLRRSRSALSLGTL